jgi:CheY-like chemotaxis protein
MITYDFFEKELHDGLGRLYDPDYQPSAEFCHGLGCSSNEGSTAIRNKVQLAIAKLKPPADTPSTTYTKMVYELLYNRYCLKLTQEETAYRINVSRRTINRLQHNAIHILTGVLWEQGQPTNLESGAQPRESSPVLPSEKRFAVQALDWNEQLQHELNSLETTTPNALSNIEDVINDALSIINATKLNPGIRIKTISIQPKLVAPVHPVMLEQVLISSLKRLVPYAVNSEIAVYARLEDGNAKITLTCSCSSVDWNEIDLIKEIPASKYISIEVAKESHQVFMWITMPSVGKLSVLVVDDNEDMVQFYRDCTIGTLYQITHLAQGRELTGIVRQTKPDIIILDVMLPDIDGWRLLMRIHEDPETRDIPVLVCSVVREEDLALSLGAVKFLSKPVSPSQFIQALDQILPQAATADSTAPKNSAGFDGLTGHL